MALLETFATVTGTIKGVAETAKTLIDIRDDATFKIKSIELLSQINSAYEAAIKAQESQSALLRRNQELEAEIAGFKNWEAEKQRYQLREIPPGVYVRSLRAGMENGEPTHDLCETCYQKNIKSILHRGEPNNGLTRLRCGNGCPELRTGRFSAPTHARTGRGHWMEE